jgi:hypothetical protein
MMKKIKWNTKSSLFSVLQNLFLQGVEFSDLQAFETFFFRFELWQETGSIMTEWESGGRETHDGHLPQS